MAGILEILQVIFLQPLNALYSSIFNLAPELITTIVSLLISYLISHYIGLLVTKTLHRIRIDRHLRVETLKDTLGATSLATLFGAFTKWGLFILLVDKIFSLIRLGGISDLLLILIFLLEKIILAALTILIGLVIIDFFTLKVFVTKSKSLDNVKKGIRIILLMIIFFTILEQFGLKPVLAENIFLLIIGSILFALALAFGIGLGLGMKDEAKKIIKQLKKLK